MEIKIDSKAFSMLREDSLARLAGWLDEDPPPLSLDPCAPEEVRITNA
ncbi:MAG TPA: hypothetical protein PLL43_03665 [Accumulibacter sp.]|jgi:hypothetical protein|nr:hypothetical protein [Accumulibacter sp.]